MSLIEVGDEVEELVVKPPPGSRLDNSRRQISQVITLNRIISSRSGSRKRVILMFVGAGFQFGVVLNMYMFDIFFIIHTFNSFALI